MAEAVIGKLNPKFVRVAKNTIWQVVTSAIVFGSSLFLTAVIARTTSVETLGRYSFVTAFAIQFSFACDFGLSVLLIREVARSRVRAPALLADSLVVSSILTASTLVLILLLVASLGYSREVTFQVGLAAIWMILGVAYSLFHGVFSGLERMEYGTLVTSIERGIVLVGAIRALFVGTSLEGFLVLLIVSRLAALFVALWIYLRLGPGITTPHFFSAKALFLASVPFGMNLLLSNLYLRLDVILLSYFRGDIDVGLYKAGDAFFFPMIVIAASFNTSLLPLLSRSHLQHKDQLASAYDRSLSYVFVVGIPIAVGLHTIAAYLIPVVFGDGYLPSVQVLRILSWALPLRFVNNTLGTVLTAADHQGLRTRAVAAAMVFNLISNLLVVPRWGFIAASVTTVLTDVLLFLVLYHHVSKKVHPISLLRKAWRVLASSAIIPIVVLLVPSSVWPLSILISAMLYSVLIVTIGGIPRRDIRAAVSLLKGVSPRWDQTGTGL